MSNKINIRIARSFTASQRSSKTTTSSKNIITAFLRPVSKSISKYPMLSQSKQHYYYVNNLTLCYSKFQLHRTKNCRIQTPNNFPTRTYKLLLQNFKCGIKKSQRRLGGTKELQIELSSLELQLIRIRCVNGFLQNTPTYGFTYTFLQSLLVFCNDLCT